MWKEADHGLTKLTRHQPHLPTLDGVTQFNDIRANIRFARNIPLPVTVSRDGVDAAKTVEKN